MVCVVGLWVLNWFCEFVLLRIDVGIELVIVLSFYECRLRFLCCVMVGYDEDGGVEKMVEWVLLWGSGGVDYWRRG